MTLHLRHAVRSLRHTPGFTFAAVLTLALGIGVNTAIFTMLDAVLLKPLALPDADELVTLYENPLEGVADADGGTGRYLRFSYPRFRQLEAALGDNGSLAAMTRTSQMLARLSGNPEPFVVSTQLVSARYFGTLGVTMALGRPVDARDLQAGAPAVAVIGHGLWTRLLGGSPDAIGQSIDVNNVRVTVVGITPPGFGGVWQDAAADLWLPLALQPALAYRNNVSSYGTVDADVPWMTQDAIAWLNLVGRIPEARQPRARAALEAANRDGLRELAQSVYQDPEGRRQMMAQSLVIEPFARGFSGLRARFSDALFALAGLVMLVLLITCANIANLLLARSAARIRETQIRLSLGAARRHLIAQSVSESLLLAFAGGAAGLLIGAWTTVAVASAFLDTTRDRLPPVFAPDERVLAATLAISALTVLLTGFLPALRAGWTGPGGLLGTQQPMSATSVVPGMKPLVAAQLALCCVAVLAAALLGRTLVNLTRLDPGFETERLVQVAINAATSGHSRDEMPAAINRLVAAVRSVPGVRAAAATRCGLLVNCTWSAAFRLGDPDEARHQLQMNFVGPSYFSTAGIAVQAGREFDTRDARGAREVAVVNEAFLRRFMPGVSPIGRRVIGDDVEIDAEIVGVVRDIRPISLRTPAPPTLFFPIAQHDMLPFTINARLDGDPRAAVQPIREAIRRAEPGMLVTGVTPISRIIERNVSRERLVAQLAAAFGGLALLLAAVGLYGVLSYAVGRRRQEFGVRLALGAQPASVARIVLREAACVVVAGVAAGLVAAFWASRLLDAVLFETGGTDSFAYGLVVVVLSGVTLAAAYLPARRAARLDPMAVLRAE